MMIDIKKHKEGVDFSSVNLDQFGLNFEDEENLNLLAIWVGNKFHYSKEVHESDHVIEIIRKRVLSDPVEIRKFVKLYTKNKIRVKRFHSKNRLAHNINDPI